MHMWGERAGKGRARVGPGREVGGGRKVEVRRRKEEEEEEER